ncbi:hypothetical protein [Verrucosispora sp. WMMD573]|uniref:hypothetical protein n=1 Tax=Verrucosispora sp. WMMD573 TaxID=3015149 RepID=UPI00248CA0E8|nr:hypothetical protein [Verrucosispora sp. WMMD573]WBB53656.1 hypothetical protein O7601_24315 [Verrucosispora sp. WMMD573]
MPGTGVFIGASLTTYFGIPGMTAWIRGEFGGAALPLLLEMGGYTLWGAGRRVVLRVDPAAAPADGPGAGLIGSMTSIVRSGR